MNQLHEDETGSFQELAHNDDVEFGQLSVLKVNLGCHRGGHYHTRKKEWFCCIHGKCIMEMINVQNQDRRIVDLDGSKREFVLVHPYELHTVFNCGKESCEVLIIVSEKYDKNNPDTIKAEVSK